mmetsp:Transcript_96387/g.267836  ORF Transcript_96387/g.267836 Transcript_96387/m.267836 type:complete len:597 (+) Transcript_96387:999-2789(+)
MVVHAGIQAALAFLVEGVRRHRQDGQLRALGQAADGTCGIQPVQDRHLNVHQHEGVVTVLDHVDRLLPVAGDVHDHAGAADQCHGHLLVDRVVLGQQHLARLCRGQRGQAFSGRVRARQRVGHRFVGLAGGGGLDVKLEPEAAAAAGLAVHADPAAHQFGQAAADGQAQPGAAVAARGGLVGLLEVLEQAILSIGIDADAAVLHLEAHRQALRGRRALAACRQAHKAAVGELDRIAGKVQQQLGDALRVTQQLDAAQGRRDIAFDLEALGGSALQGHVGDVVQHFVDRELNPLELHLAGLDLGEVEHVVDDAQQMLGRIGDLLQPLLLHRLDGVALGQVGQADDGVHRRADLMADGGQEGRLVRVGRLQHRGALAHPLFGQCLVEPPVFEAHLQRLPQRAGEHLDIGHRGAEHQQQGQRDHPGQRHRVDRAAQQEWQQAGNQHRVDMRQADGRRRAHGHHHHHLHRGQHHQPGQLGLEEEPAGHAPGGAEHQAIAGQPAIPAMQLALCLQAQALRREAEKIHRQPGQHQAGPAGEQGPVHRAAEPQADPQQRDARRARGQPVELVAGQHREAHLVQVTPLRLIDDALGHGASPAQL